MLVGGTTARNVDSLEATADRLPLMIALLVGATLVLMFLAFGSILLPVKAVLMSALSLAATFGVLVWIFQDGHGADLLNVTPAPPEVGIVVLMAAVVFGLSTDYEVFLLSRMVEARTRGATTAEAVTTGLARTGRVISAAAVLLIVVTGAFALSSVTTMRFVGVGMIIALVLDATVVRMLLVPAVLGLLGDAAWWAPGPLRRLQERAGLAEYADEELFPTVSVGRHAAPDTAVARSSGTSRPRHASDEPAPPTPVTAPAASTPAAEPTSPSTAPASTSPAPTSPASTSPTPSSAAPTSPEPASPDSTSPEPDSPEPSSPEPSSPEPSSPEPPSPEPPSPELASPALTAPAPTSPSSSPPSPPEPSSPPPSSPEPSSPVPSSTPPSPAKPSSPEPSSPAPSSAPSPTVPSPPEPSSPEPAPAAPSSPGSSAATPSSPETSSPASSGSKRPSWTGPARELPTTRPSKTTTKDGDASDQVSPAPAADSAPAARVSTGEHQPVQAPTGEQTAGASADKRKAGRIRTGEQAAPVPKDKRTRVPAGEQPVRVPSGEQPTRVPTGEQPARVPTGEQPKRVPTGEHPTRVPTGEQPVRVPTGEQRAVAPAASATGDESDPEKTVTRLPAPGGGASPDADDTPESRPTVDLAARVKLPTKADEDEPDPETTAVLETPRTVDLSARRRR